MSDLSDNRAAARAKAAADARAALRLPRPRGRIDMGLGAVLVAAALGLGVLGWVGANHIRAAGWFAPPLLSEVEDPRILQDYRDNGSPMVDLLVTGGDLLIGRQDGTLDRFALDRRTFATETLPRDGRLSGDLALLSSPCTGADCAEPGVVHAVTDRGGIAERHGTRWQVLLGDAAFVGADGQPVEQADLLGWAVSDDGALVLLDAGTKGIGLFNQRDSSWRTGRAITGDAQGPLFYRGAFWIGNDTGLFRIAPDATPLVPAQPVTTGRVLSLAHSESDGLLALVDDACADGTQGCRALLRISRFGAPETLMEEIEANPGLNDAGLFHVALQAGNLVTIGSAGVHRYDTGARNWRLLDPQPPTGWFAETDGRRIHVAFPDRVVTFENAHARAEVRIDSPLDQLLPGDGSDLFGLDRAGRIVLLKPPEAQVLAAADMGAPEGARFSAALQLGNRLVAIGRKGVLVHDMIRRRYSFTPSAALPQMPPADALLRQAGANSFWAVGRTDGAVWQVTIDGDFPALALQATRLTELGEAVVQARPSGASLDLVTAGGQVYRLAPDGSEVHSLVGAPLNRSLAPRAMAVAGQTLLFTDGRGIWTYDEAVRGWAGPMPAPPGAQLVDIGVTGNRIMGLAGDGRLWSAVPDGNWSLVSGGTEGAAFASTALTDALSEGGTLYLAADGRVQSYLPADRRFGDAWRARGNGARLLGVDGGEPIWTTSTGVFRGDDPVFAPAGFLGAWQGASGPVALAEHKGRRYATGGGECLYLGSAPPQGALRDVVPLGSNRLLVRTERGVGLYEPDLHRWLGVTGLGSGTQGRLLVLAGHLVQLEADAIRSVPLTAIRIGDSCSVAPVAIDWALTSRGRAVTLVDGAPEGLVLGQDGALARWRTGALEPVAPPPGDAPALDQTLRAYRTGDHLEFLTTDAFWSYDLTRRVWSSRGFADAPRRIAQIDMQHGDTGLVVSAWDENGQLWAGTEEDGADRIRFAPVARPVLPVLPFPPGDLRDMALIGDEIAVLTDHRLLLYPPGKADAHLDITLPDPAGSWQLGVDQGGSLVLADGPASARVSIHRLDPRQNGRRDLARIAATYHPGNDRAHAFVTEAGDPALVRIDADLNTWRCALRAGREPACDLVTAPPLALASEQVRAWDRNTRTLLTDTALLQLDAASRPVTAIDGPQPGPDVVLLHNDGALILWEGPGRALWHITPGSADRILPRVDALRPLPRQLQVLANGQVRGLAGGAPVNDAPPAPGSGQGVTATHFTENGLVWRLEDGTVLAQDGALESDPLLAFGDDVRSILPLGLAVEGAPQWWLREGSDGTLSRLAATACGTPAITPPRPGARIISPTAPPLLPPDDASCVTELPFETRLTAGEQILDITMIEGAPHVITNHSTWRLTGGALTDAQSLPATTTPPDLVDARLPHPFAMVDGVSYLNPPSIRENSLHGGATVQALNLLSTQLPRAFSNGWFTWLREDGQFRLATNGEAALLSPKDAFPDGRFAALHEGRGAMLDDGETSMWLNPHGLWAMRDGAVQRVSTTAHGLPEALDDGHFLLGDTAIATANGTATTRAQPRRVIAGPLSFDITAMPMQLHAMIEVEGQNLPAAARRGFLHDQRLAAVQGGGQSFYLTPVGLMPVDQFGPLRAIPADTPATGTRIEAEAGQLFLQTPSGWLQSPAGGGGWAAGSAPFRNLELARENGRLWSRRGGELVLEPEDANQTWRVAGQGVDFDIDHLLGFTATPTQSVAVTRAGTMAAADLAGLRGVHSARAPAPQGTGLDALRSTPSQHVLFARGDGGTTTIWDPDATTWRPPQPQERAWEHRVAVTASGLTITFAPQPQMEIQATEPGGGNITLPFTWVRGEQMPFDRATAIYSDDGGHSLLVGTGLGLRRLTLHGSRFGNDALVIPAAAQAADLAVTAVGRPEATPSRIEAIFADGACLDTPTTAQPLARCQVTLGLDRRHIVTNDRWQWVQTPNRVEGWYLLAGGGTLPVPQPFTGAMPHDLLADRLECDGTLIEQWRDANVVLAGLQQIAVPGLQTLICQRATAQLGGGVTLASGLYAMRGTDALRFGGAGFDPVSDTESRGIDDRITGRVIADHARLRYGLVGDELQAEVRSLSDIWQPIEWSSGRLPLDQPLALAFRNGLQSVTPAGVVMAPQGRLDPAQVVVMGGPSTDSIAVCAPQGAETLDGRTHGLDRSTDMQVRLYCQDGSWLEGVTDGRRDEGTFAPAEAAPSARVLVDVPGMWAVTQIVAPSGDSRTISIAFRDEPARLAAGRFDFDVITSISAPFAAQTELLTASGWWRAPAGMPQLAETRRATGPFDPRAVAALSRDLPPRGDDVQPGLCLATEGGDARFWDGGRAPLVTAACRELRGSDPIWDWWQTGGQPQAMTVALNGITLERQLVAGRFSDLIVTGAPMLAADGTLLAPTSTGLLHLPPDGGQPAGIHAFAGEGVLARSQTGAALWVARDGVHSLSGASTPATPQDLNCEGLATLAATLPETVQMLRAQDAGPGHAHILLKQDPVIVPALLDCTTGTAQPWTSEHVVTDHPRRLGIGEAAPDMLRISLTDGTLQLDDRDRRVTAPLPLPLRNPRGLVVHPDLAEALLIDDHRLWSINLGRAVERLSTAPPAPPAPAPAPAPEPQTAPPPSPSASEATTDDRSPDTASTHAVPHPAAETPDPVQPEPAPADTGAPDTDTPAIPASASEENEAVLDVRAVQQALAAALRTPLAVDGIIGPRTRAAIAEWQAMIGAEETGYLSPAQLDLLIGTAP